MADKETCSREEKAKKLITEEHVLQALTNDKGRWVQLKSFKIEDFLEPGDAYSSYVTGVVAQYSEPNKDDSEVSYIVKVNPCYSAATVNPLTVEAFRKEYKFYSHMLPQLNEVLTTNGQHALRLPKLIYGKVDQADCEIIFLEDMRKKGFEKFDRTKTLDKEHGTLVMAELARLHATGQMLLNRNRDDPVLKTFDCLKDIFGTGLCEKYMESWFPPSIKNSIDIASKKDKYKRAVEVLTEMMPGAMDLVVEQLKSEVVFATVCHGDCYIKNLMFRYEDGKPVEVCLVDLQVVRYSSLATDLNYLLYSSFSGETRKQHLDALLAVYYKQFQDILCCELVPMFFSEDELLKEYRSKSRYGLIMASALLAQLTPGQLPQVSDVADAELDTFAQKFTDKMKDGVDQHNARYFDMFDELIEEGILK